MGAVRVHDIGKSFGPVSVLKGIDLDIARGEFLTLLGPSGCGKSTLLRIIAGLEAQDAGSVWIGDRRVDGVAPKRRDIAMVFQSYALYPHMTVAANLALPLRMRRLNGWQRLPLVGGLLPGTGRVKREIAAEVARLADTVGIGHLLTRKPGQLSGGQRQRVAIGRAIVRHPAVFLMDEPLSSLDAKLRVQMRAELKDLHRRLGATFIYVTHDQAEAMMLSDRVAVMLDGALLQVAPPGDIYSDPVNRTVAEFVGSPKINMLDGIAGGQGAVEVVGVALDTNAAAPPGTSVTLGIRPEAFSLAGRADRNVLTGLVRLVEHLGSDLYIHVDLPAVAEPLIARVPTERSASIHVGGLVHLSVAPQSLLLFDRDGARLRHQPVAIRSFA